MSYTILTTFNNNTELLHNMLMAVQDQHTYLQESYRNCFQIDNVDFLRDAIENILTSVQNNQIPGKIIYPRDGEIISYEEYKNAEENRQITHIVLVVNNKSKRIDGFVSVEITHSTVYINNLCISPEGRGKGLAVKMIDECINIGKKVVFDPKKSILKLNTVLDMKGKKTDVSIQTNLFYIFVRRYHFSNPVLGKGYDRVELSRPLDLKVDGLLNKSKSEKIYDRITILAQKAVDKLGSIHSKMYSQFFDAEIKFNDIDPSNVPGISEEILRNNIIVLAHGKYHEKLIPVTNNFNKSIFTLSTPGLSLSSIDVFNLLENKNNFIKPFPQKFLYQTPGGDFYQSTYYMREIRPGEFLFDYTIAFYNPSEPKLSTVVAYSPDGKKISYNAASVYIPYGGKYGCRVDIYSNNSNAFIISWYNFINSMLPNILEELDLVLKSKHIIFDKGHSHHPIIFVNCGDLDNLTTFFSNSYRNAKKIVDRSKKWNIPSTDVINSDYVTKGYSCMYPSLNERKLFEHNETELLHLTITTFLTHIYDRYLLTVTRPLKSKLDSYVEDVKKRIL